MSDRDVRKLAKIVADHSRQIKGLSGGPQAAYSSIEGGSMDAYDNDGKMRLRIGAQDDGTHAVKYVQGPPPPRPTAPVVSVDGPVVRVRWDGMLLGGHIPEDFARIDVHFALASDDIEDASAVRGNLATSAGNETVLAATQTGAYRVGLVAMSQSRARSEMSDTVEVEVELVDLKGAIDTAVDNSRGGSNHYTPTPPPGTDHDPERDLWFDTSEDADGLVSYTPHRWDEDEQKWMPVGDEHISVLRQKLEEAAAELEAMPRPNYGSAEPTHGAPDGSAYFQVDDTARETFAWAGVPHASESIKYRDGAEVARNIVINGDFNNGTAGWVSSALSATATTAFNTLMWGGLGGNLMQAAIDTETRYADIHQRGRQVPAGKYVGFSAHVATRSDPRVRMQLTWYGATTGYSPTPWRAASFYGGTWFHDAFQAPHATNDLRIQIQLDKTAGLAGQHLWADRIIAVIADTREEALKHSEEYWDGDTPARTVGGFDKIVAQWERRDGAWVQVPIRSEAIASLEVGKLIAGMAVMDRQVVRKLFAEVVVAEMAYADAFIGTNAFLEGAITADSGIIREIDLGVATVGYLNGARIEAGTIDTPQLAFGAATGDVLSVDALNFKTAVGLDIRGSSFRAGDAVEITEDFGIRQFGPDGALNVSLPSDGSPAEFRGDLSARTLTATGRMSIQGPGAIASGGVLELESGVVPPVAGPQITNVWDRTTFPPLTDQEAPAGLAWADGHFWRCVTTSVGLSDGGRTRIEKISPTGELVGGWDTTFRVSVNGITILNGELYVLAARLSVSGDDSTPVRPRMVVVYDLQGVEQRRWEYPNYGTGTYQPGIGNDGLNIVIAQSWANGDHTYRTYNVNTGALVRQYDTGFKMRSNVTQILFGDFDYGDGRKKIIAQQRSDLMAFVCYNSAETAPDDVARSWNAADFQSPIGLVWDGARFHSLTQTGDLVSYQSHETNRFIGDDEDDWWGAVTWATGSQETTAGPATRFRYMHRAQLRVQNGDVPGGVEAARFYTSKGAAEPDRTDLQWRVTSEQPHEPLRITSISSSSGGTNPPATNTFITDAPGLIRSTLGNFRVDGTGAGQWGTLNFHADGTTTGKGTIVTGRVDHPQVSPGGESHQVVVTFPAGRFTRPPTVLLTNTNGLLAPVVVIDSTTATSATIRVWNWTDATAAVSRTMWAAIDEGA